jgi:hypothetical protein
MRENRLTRDVTGSATSPPAQRRTRRPRADGRGARFRRAPVDGGSRLASHAPSRPRSSWVVAAAACPDRAPGRRAAGRLPRPARHLAEPADGPSVPVVGRSGTPPSSTDAAETPTGGGHQLARRRLALDRMGRAPRRPQEPTTAPGHPRVAHPAPDAAARSAHPRGARQLLPRARPTAHQSHDPATPLRWPATPALRRAAPAVGCLRRQGGRPIAHLKRTRALRRSLGTDRLELSDARCDVANLAATSVTRPSKGSSTFCVVRR